MYHRISRLSSMFPKAFCVPAVGQMIVTMLNSFFNCRRSMKINKITSLVLGLAMVVSGCAVNELNEGKLPAGEYVRVSLTGGDGSVAPVQNTRATWEDPNGSGKLGFKWEDVAIDSEETNKLAMIISNGTAALTNQETPQAGAAGAMHTGLAVTTGADPHLAGFETVRYYSTDDLNRAQYVYAVAGGADVTVDTEGKKHICSLEMPSSFAQGDDQDPSFLRDYMYMYATAAYNVNSNTRLNFKHIPATFRFIITNGTESAITINSVSVSLVEGGAVASKTADVAFGWAANNAELSFGAETYETITTNLPADGVTVQKGKKYTTYSMALPLASDEAFAGKVISFTAKCSDGKNLTYLLAGETLANANGSGSNICNWVGGKSYTIRLNIGEGGKTSGTMLSNKDITVVSTVGGSFTLKYVDASGAPLANYADICTMNVADMATYAAFIDENVAPATADAIGIYDEADVKVGTIAINGNRADNSGLLYSVGMLSDVHLNTQNSYYGDDASADFQKALNFFNSSAVNAAFTVTCGDITEHGTEAEFAKYKEIVNANSATPVYTTTGNHDCQSAVNETIWKQYTGYGLTYEVSKTLSNGKTDHYLFVGMSTWKDNLADPYTITTLTWLKSKLEAYKNERCFVITHLFFPEGAGNMLEIYPEGNWLKGSQLRELKAQCERYKNAIWFSGHSHWKWSLQQYDDKSNVYRIPDAGWTIHVPSCAKPSDSDGVPGSSSARQEKLAQSEGAVINVYENHIDVLGVDLTYGKYLPVATYRLDTALETVEETPIDDTYLKAANFTYYKGSGNMSVTDVEGMPGYIDVIFNENGQGYFVKNSTFTEGHDSSNQVFDLDIEYLQCWTGWGTSSQTEVATIDKVGFYDGGYNLVSTLNCYVNSVSGVQFQTKSDCNAAFPIKLRMKARGKFYLKDENIEAAGTRLTAECFTDNDGKKGATVEDVADMPGYVDMIFTGPSQGFYVKNSTFTYGYDTNYQTVSISVDDVQCWTGWDEETGTGTEVSTISGVGFYAGSYLLTTNSRCYVNAKRGVQFHTSSSCVGPYPIKIRMKANADFNVKSSAPSIYTTAEHFIVNPNKAGTDAPTCVDVEGMPDYIDVTFNEKGQGFYIKHHTQSASTSKVDVTVEYAKMITKNADGTETERDFPAGIAFYAQPIGGSLGYNFEIGSTMMFNTTDIKRGTTDEVIAAKVLAFQLSGSNYGGSYPVTVRMKLKTIFYL